MPYKGLQKGGRIWRQFFVFVFNFPPFVVLEFFQLATEIY